MTHLAARLSALEARERARDAALIEFAHHLALMPLVAPPQPQSGEPK